MPLQEIVSGKGWVGVTELQAIFRDQEKKLREETENKELWWQAKSQEEGMLWKAKEYV